MPSEGGSTGWLKKSHPPCSAENDSKRSQRTNQPNGNLQGARNLMKTVLPAVWSSQLSGVSSTALAAEAARPSRAKEIFMVENKREKEASSTQPSGFFVCEIRGAFLSSGKQMRKDEGYLKRTRNTAEHRHTTDKHRVPSLKVKALYSGT